MNILTNTVIWFAVITSYYILTFLGGIFQPATSPDDLQGLPLPPTTKKPLFYVEARKNV